MPRKPKSTPEPPKQAEERTNARELQKQQNEDAKSQCANRALKYTWFTMILYPQDDETNMHKQIISFIETTPLLFPEWIWVLHDRDINEETGEIKKPHVHMLIKTSEPYTIKGIAKAFLNQVKGELLQGAHHPRALVLYYAHKTLESREDGKAVYSKDEFHGTLSLLKYLEQSANFVQKSVLSNIKEYGYMLDVLENADDLERDEIYAHANLYNNISNQQINRRKTGKYKDGNAIEIMIAYLQKKSEIDKMIKEWKNNGSI